eukprot:6765651-Karenia_brevis.AAC.1
MTNVHYLVSSLCYKISKKPSLSVGKKLYCNIVFFPCRLRGWAHMRPASTGPSLFAASGPTLGLRPTCRIRVSVSVCLKVQILEGRWRR